MSCRILRQARADNAVPSWALGESFAPERCADLAAEAPCAASSATRVRRSDLDMNEHVNNASYLKWLLEDVPEGVHEAMRVAGVDIEFRAEARYGDDVVSRCAQRAFTTEASDGSSGRGDGDTVTMQHSLLRPRDGVELLRANTHWRRPLERNA